MQSENAVLIDDSEDEIFNGEKDVRKVTSSKALDSLDDVQCFAEIQGDRQMNVVLNELIRKVETLKLDKMLSICF